MVLSWCVNTVEEKFRKNRLQTFGEPKLRGMSVKLAEESNRERGENMDKTYRCPKCGDSKAEYNYGLRNFVCPIDHTPLSEYQ